MDEMTNNMVILSEEQIEKMTKVSDFLLKHPSNITVADIRRKFKLSRDEYNMIYDLTMPLFRKQSSTSYWRTKYIMLKDAISTQIKAARSLLKLPRTEQELRAIYRNLVNDIEDIVEGSDIGKLNERMQQEYAEDFDEDFDNTESA